MERRSLLVGAGAALALAAVPGRLLTRAPAPAGGRPSVSILDHGARGDGATPDDAAFQAAIDALPADGGEVILPPGTFLLTQPTHSAGKPLVLRGAGHAVTRLKIAHPTNDIFVHTGVESIELRDFTIFHVVARTAGAYIRIDPGAGRINYSSAIERVRMYGHHVGIDLVRCADARVRDCVFVGGPQSDACLLLRNLTNADSGDHSVTGCFFSGPAGTGVRQESSGGLRLADNKFNGLVTGYLLAPDMASAGTSVLLIQGNSFENAKERGIWLRRGTSAAIFTYGIISSNEFGYAPTGLEVTATARTFYDFLIHTNIFAIPARGTGIRLDGGNTFVVKDNILDGIGGIANGIVVTGMEAQARIGPNVMRNVSVPLTNASITTVST